VQLIEGQRQVAGSVDLVGSIAQDRFPLRQLVGELSSLLEEVPEDPHLVFPDSVESTEDREVNRLPPSHELMSEVLDRSKTSHAEWVGHYMAGRVVEAVATSIGLRRWYETNTYHLELSLCVGEDRAAKVYLGGSEWDRGSFERRIQRAEQHAKKLRENRSSLQPGRYRAYIAPVGWKMVMQTLGYRGAFSQLALRNGTSPFVSLHKDQSLSQEFSMQESTRLGWIAPFNSEGLRRPPQVPLFDGGQACSTLVSGRSSMEFNVPTTGSEALEMPQSFEISGGSLQQEELAERVGDGLWLEYLHYLNLSDRATASVTGLARFAAFRVRDGEIAEPIEVARFDDSVLDLLGERLIGLTADREQISDGRSYGRRSLGGALLPGAIVEDLRIVS